MSYLEESCFDVLNDFSREEIILWLKEYCWKRDRPVKSDLILIRIQIKRAKFIKESEQLAVELRAIDLEKRDEYARSFNAATSLDEKMQLAEKLIVYENQLRAWFVKNDKLKRKEMELGRLYRMYEMELKNERSA